MAAEIAKPSEVHGSDVDLRRLATLRKRCGIRTHCRNRDVVRSAQVIFIAVKPHQIRNVLEDIRGAVSDRHLIISIAAGVPLSFIESILARGRMVRVMPNMPCLVSAGMSVFTLGSRTTSADRRTVRRLLGSFGQVLELPETVFDSVTAISGSGPAFFSYLLDKMADAAINKGLDRKIALRLAEQTMFGTAKLLMEHGIDPGELVAAVATPNGTTVAGLSILEKHGTGIVLRKAVRAAAKRCRELAPPPGSGAPVARPVAGAGSRRH